MNYDNQKLIDMLAAEYVLGTLKGPARKRFQRLMLSSNRVREATWMWEQHLNNLASSIKSVPQIAMCGRESHNGLSPSK